MCGAGVNKYELITNNMHTYYNTKTNKSLYYIIFFKSALLQLFINADNTATIQMKLMYV